MPRAKASAKPVSRAGDTREDDGEDRAQPAGAEHRRRFLDFLLAFRQHRLHGAHDEGQPDEHERHDHAERRIGDLDAERCEQRPDQPFGA